MAWVRAEGVWKRFLLQKDRADSVGQLLVRMIPSRSHRRVTEPFWALRDVSLEMPVGTSLGIIGSNGSGKSTMLKLLTRTMVPTRGQIDVRGKVSALIELGAGFHPDFTGRENIILNASILGIRRREIERRMDRIIDFSEIRQFIDTPVKYYSSGMQARLGFSVAIHVDAEILVVDEVLAVGDQAFQRKCMARIQELKVAGVSILLVSHDMTSIEHLMDNVVWIDHGVVREVGLPGDVVRAYQHDSSGGAVDSGAGTGPDGASIVARARVGDGARTVDVVASGDAFEIEVELENLTQAPLLGYLELVIRQTDGLPIAEISGLADGMAITLRPGVNKIAVMIRELRLIGGSYEVDGFFRTAGGAEIAAWRRIARFGVTALAGDRALVKTPHEWHLADDDFGGA